MFSTSMIASSTTSPSAITRPASTIVLIVPPRQWSTSAAASSDSGIAVRLIERGAPVEQEQHQHDDDQHAAEQQRADRLSSDISMKVAGRKIVESISTSASPGRRSRGPLRPRA